MADYGVVGVNASPRACGSFLPAPLGTLGPARYTSASISPTPLPFTLVTVSASGYRVNSIPI